MGLQPADVTVIPFFLVWMPDKEGSTAYVVLPSLKFKDRLMATFDEYINSLEGKDDVDPLAVARELHELHVQELGTREAKIELLNGSIAEKDTAISERDREVTKYKAMNLDLVMQIPANQNQEFNRRDDDEKPTGSSIKIGDLFNKEVRKRHGI